MKLLATIKDGELEPTFQVRSAARAILFGEKNRIPLLFVSKHNFHKLPGGGIEKGEDNIAALRREALEEAGCEIEVGVEVGVVLEHRSKFNLKQTSYCYLGSVVSKGKSHLEQGELDAGFQLKWVTLDEAVLLMENDKPDNYEGKFIQQRDLTFLREAKKLTKN